jgi:fructosamine-3-kinase
MHLNNNDETAYLLNRQSLFNPKADIPLSSVEIKNLLSIKNEEIESKKKNILALCEHIISKKIASIDYLANSGTLHLLFEVTDIDNLKYIVKVNKDQSPFQSYDFFIDQWMMKKLASNHVLHLEIYAADCSREKFAFDYQVMDKVAGDALISFKDQQAVYDSHIIKLGIYLAKLHHSFTAVNNYGLLNGLKLTQQTCTGVFSTWTDYLYTNFEHHLDYCVKNSVFDRVIAQEIKTIFYDNDFIFNNIKPSLLHGDLNDHNIFVVEDQLLIIDWEDALCGDPIFDIALWGTFMHHHEKLNFLIQGYETIAKLSSDFYLKYWLYYLRIILAKTVVRYRFDYYKTDKIPAINRIMMPLENIRKILKIESYV